jgi:hypothetical protein
MKRAQNMTITVDEDVARWARIRAAEENTSVSRLVGDLLRDHMRQRQRFEQARRQFQALRSRVISSAPYPTREELHDRAGLR